MIKMFKTYTESLDYFKEISLKKNEYLIRKDIATTPSGERLRTHGLHSFVPEKLVENITNIDGYNSRIIVNNEAVNRFHPNNINNKDKERYL